MYVNTALKYMLKGKVPVIFVIFFSLCALPYLVLDTSAAIAVGTETARNDEILHAHEEGLPCTGECLTQAQYTEAEWLGGKDGVSIATQHETPISKAPGIVTVITAEEIKNLGYRTFAEILRTVPGFELLKSGAYGEQNIATRGLKGAEKVRVMINGHLVNNPLTSEAFSQFDDFPVGNIKKIEIIRGPGSALYGENAFLAVINIITFKAEDVDGVKLNSGYGSFDTKEGSIVFGKIYGNIGISGMVHWRETDGFDGIVESDLESRFDPAHSVAPGSVQDWRQEYGMNLKTTYKDFYTEVLYNHNRRGPFIGPQYILDDGSSDIKDNYFFVETGYKKTFEEIFTLRPRVYYDQSERRLFIQSFPDGTTLPLGATSYTYPDGTEAISNWAVKTTGAEIPVDYALFEGNILTVGTEYRLMNLTNLSTYANLNTITLEPLDSLQDFTDTRPFAEDHTRRVLSVYLQDTWDIIDTLNLTLGVRNDSYSDFGGAISPRAGLTWSFLDNASLKVLYGEAFRAPGFREMYTTNQPAVQGNPDLKPETISTYEIGVDYKFNTYVSSRVNYFYNDIKDLIALRVLSSAARTSQFENTGNARIQGVETETKVDISPGNYVFMNYTFQHPEDEQGDELPFTAQHHGNFGVNVHYWKYMNTNLNTFVSGTRPREETDTRDDLPGYALLNLSVIGKEFFKTMEIQGTVFNLLNKNYSDPGPTLIPDDFPRPGRTFWVGLSYQF